ncbi:MAG TPA: sulfurtransferase TusA family protein [Caulobacteraceae bacterium]|jgi:tRNA 2-thiouridine synthesizing protein A|nr:sulfurtransferase TusA family protein [Caulobacteraceae bacterium]
MEDPADDPAAAATVDARGHRCPTPTLRLRRALEAVRPGDQVLLLADDPMARIDVPHFVAEVGVDLVASSTDGTVLRFLVEKR